MKKVHGVTIINSELKKTFKQTVNYQKQLRDTYYQEKVTQSNELNEYLAFKSLT
jgi:hypothetical protein